MFKTTLRIEENFDGTEIGATGRIERPRSDRLNRTGVNFNLRPTVTTGTDTDTDDDFLLLLLLLPKNCYFYYY